LLKMGKKKRAHHKGIRASYTIRGGHPNPGSPNDRLGLGLRGHLHQTGHRV
jgi:hypothetical protein